MQQAALLKKSEELVRIPEYPLERLVPPVRREKVHRPSRIFRFRRGGVGKELNVEALLTPPVDLLLGQVLSMSLITRFILRKSMAFSTHWSGAYSEAKGAKASRKAALAQPQPVARRPRGNNPAATPQNTAPIAKATVRAAHSVQ